ncbi:Ig-like domain-containing protein [Cloacibacillus porcorum]|uniref:Ig-like domain-containing protein n=1 Tax=Cloacibacillus porcorum TaxID=1197717 RepID=UPI0023F3AE18|nr:Ig-like domain-containing protein [Cloacibacillus porcorum]
MTYNNFPSGPDTEDKIFLLSYGEVDDGASSKALGKKYGFDGMDSRIAEPTDYANAEKGSDLAYWWLRSPGMFINGASVVFSGGGHFSNNVEKVHYGLRPAFRLNLKSLFFTSPATDGKQTDVTTTLYEQKYKTYTHQPTSRDFTEHKLTIATNTYKLASADVTSEKITTSADINVELNYSGASTGDGYYLAAVVTSGDKTLYYGRIKELKTEAEADGTAEFTIPKLNDGEEVYVFVEGKEEYDSSDRNKLTDFVSLPICLNGEGREIVATSMVESITVNPSTITLKEKEVKQLTVTFAPEGVKEEIVWSSSDEKVAIVEENGTVTAISEGKCTITATTEGGNSATCDVTVVKKGSSSGCNAGIPAVVTLLTLGSLIYIRSRNGK